MSFHGAGVKEGRARQPARCRNWPGVRTAWVDGFLDELRESLAAGYLTDSDPEEQAALERRIERLASLYGQQPARLARLLVEGFVERLRLRSGASPAPL